MELDIEVAGWDNGIREQRRDVVRRVIETFGTMLPERRLLIYLDDADCQNLKLSLGIANRGIHFPVKDSTVRQIQIPVPMYLLLDERLSDGATAFNYDNAIYIHNSTCQHEVGLTMTLAHEFQHFIQYGCHRRAWAANSLAANLSRETFQALGFTWADIATEHEARLVSKRAAEQLFGHQRVQEFIEIRASQPANSADADDWAFVKAIDVTAPFDLEAETRQMYQRIAAHKQELTDRWLEVADDPDFELFNPRELFSEASPATAEVG